MPDPTVLADITDLRRRIHRRPELGFKEFATTRAVSDLLKERDVPHQIRSEGTGIAVELGEGEPMVAYRADLDALPITEDRSLPWRSEIEGVMHACGHDAHTAIGAGIAITLAREELKGRVRVLFQPSEEAPGGAEAMIEDGFVDGVRGIIALHADPSLTTGTIGLKAGPITAASDRFVVVISGPGGHTARPHETPDTLLAAGALISNLEAMFSRRVDARIPRAVTFGSVHGGEASNVIPASVRLSGTVRVADQGAWQDMGPIFTELVHDIVAGHGVGVDVEYTPLIPPVICDEGVVQAIEDAGRSMIGDENVHTTYTSMGAEDFSFFTNELPGALFRLGCSDGPWAPLHSAKFQFDEAALAIGIDVGAEAVRRLLAAHGD